MSGIRHIAISGRIQFEFPEAPRSLQKRTLRQKPSRFIDWAFLCADCGSYRELLIRIGVNSIMAEKVREKQWFHHVSRHPKRRIYKFETFLIWPCLDHVKITCKRIDH